MALTRHGLEQLARRTEEVEVRPGLTVRIIELTGEDIVALGELPERSRDASFEIVARSLLDPSEEPHDDDLAFVLPLTDTDRREMGRWPGGVLERIVRAATRLNGLEEKAEDLSGNSAGAPGPWPRSASR